MECNWKCNSQHGMTSSCRFNWAPWTTNLFSLKSVFPEIRVRTWVQVVFCQNNKPLICWPIRSSNFRGLCFWQETTWTHVLTRISEKTDYSVHSKADLMNKLSQRIFIFGKYFLSYIVLKWIQQLQDEANNW